MPTLAIHSPGLISNSFARASEQWLQHATCR